MLPLLKALLSDLSPDVCERCEGIAAAVGELCCALCTLVGSLISHDLRVSWYPPNVDLDVVSILEDVVEVANDLGGEALSCCWSGGGAFVDGCLVVDEDLDGIRAFVVWVPGPLLSIGGCL